MHPDSSGPAAPPIGHGPRPPFVGRERELATLKAGLDREEAHGGGFYLISGEPGVGKTRLLEELAATAEARGVLVAWGRCWEKDDALPFWPWVQLLRVLLGSCEEDDIAAVDAHTSAQVARLLPHPRLTVAAQQPAHSEDI